METWENALKAFIITVKASEKKASQKQMEVYFTFKSVLIFQIFICIYVLVVVIVTIMVDEISNKNVA